MMSEKRFKMVEDSNGLYSIFDTEDKEDEPLIYGAEFGTEKIVDLLNTMSDEIEEVGISIKLFEDDVQIKDKKIDEQQATIRKLQDLCGESDSENAKLRLKNKELQDKIDMLCEKYDYPKGVKNE